MLRNGLSALLPVVMLSLLLPDSLIANPSTKKIIEYGWDVPYPDFVRDNIREMEKRPFEGLIFRTKGFDHVLDVRPWSKAELQPQLDTLAQIKWQKFTDNFLTLYAANRWKMDWFKIPVEDHHEHEAASAVKAAMGWRLILSWARTPASGRSKASC
jgi:hypothetical protein